MSDLVEFAKVPDLDEFELEANRDFGSLEIVHLPCRRRESVNCFTVADAVEWAEKHDCNDVPPRPEAKPVDPRFAALWGPTIRARIAPPPAFHRPVLGEGETVHIRRKP